MKTIKTTELTGHALLAAVALALCTSYDDLRRQVWAMDLDRMHLYLAAHPEVTVTDEARTSERQLRDAILGSHEPLLPGEDDIAMATEEDLWPLCEHLLDRYDIDVSSRYWVAPRRKVWLANAESPVYGATPKEAILRYYVKLKLGDEVTVDV